MTNLEKSIIAELPQIPYVIDQTSEALKWAKEVLGKGEYAKMLETTWDVTQFVKEISDPNFFKVHLVIATVLSYIPESLKEERFGQFDTASKAVEKALKAITIDPKVTAERGCFKAILLLLASVARENEDYFTLVLYGIKHDLMEITKGMSNIDTKAPITPQDYITILGYSFVMANLRMANLHMLNRTYRVFNEIEIILNELVY